MLFPICPPVPKAQAIFRRCVQACYEPQAQVSLKICKFMKFTKVFHIDVWDVKTKYSYSLRFGGFHSDQSKASLWGGRRGLTESLFPGTPSWVRPTSALAHDSLWTPSACPWFLLGKCQVWAEPLQTQKSNRFISLQIRTSEENWLEIHS